MEELIQLLPFPPEDDDLDFPKLAHINARLGHMPQHDHICAELFISLEGKAVNVINGRQIPVLPGDVYLLLPGMNHEQLEMENYRFCILKFDYDALLQEAGALKNLPGFQLIFVLEPRIRMNRELVLEGNPTLDGANLRYAETLTAILEQELQEKGQEYKAVTRQVFLALVALISRSCARRGTKPLARSTAQLARSMSFMEQHYAQPLTLDQLAAEAHYSRRHYARLFQECFGASPLAYLNQIRLRYACTLLTTTNFTSTEIALRCGFSDVAIFCRRFRSALRVTPQQYRAHNRT